MSYGVINSDDFKNSRFDKTCIQSMLAVSSLLVYFYLRRVLIGASLMSRNPASLVSSCIY